MNKLMITNRVSKGPSAVDGRKWDAPLGIGDVQNLPSGTSRFDLRRTIVWRLGDGVGKMPTRVHITIEYIYESISHLCAPKASPEDCRHVQVVDPGLEDKWAD